MTPGRRFLRARRVAKWIGLAMCLLIAGIWIASLWWTGGVDFPVGRKAVIVTVYPAAFQIVAYLSAGEQPGVPWWRAFPRPSDLDQTWGVGWGGNPGGIDGWYVIAPLWIPLACAAISTAWLFWSDHARKTPGQCPKCRYDRAGLDPAAPCPECGTSLTN